MDLPVHLYLGIRGSIFVLELPKDCIIYIPHMGHLPFIAMLNLATFYWTVISMLRLEILESSESASTRMKLMSPLIIRVP